MQLRACLFLLAVLPALACNTTIAGLGPPSDPATETFAPSLGIDISQMTQTALGVYYQDVVVGTGTEITAASDTVFLSFSGYLKDGSLFDSGNNVSFGPSVVGFRDGIVGMKEGGRRKIVVPSALGYGTRTIRNRDLSILVPRQSTLVYDVTVLRVHTPTD